MAHGEQYHSHGPNLTKTPSDYLRDIVEAVPGQDYSKRLEIIKVMRALLERKSSPELAGFIKDRLGDPNMQPQIRAFMQLLISDDQRLRSIADEGFRILERQHQEEQARAVREQGIGSQATTDVVDRSAFATAFANSRPVPDPANPHLRDPGPDLARASNAMEVAAQTLNNIVQAPSASRQQAGSQVSYQPVCSNNTELHQHIAIPVSAQDLNGPRNTWSYITNDVSVADLNVRTPGITHVAGLVIGVEGQKNVEHGFGFYLPLAPGAFRLDYTGQRPNRIRIAMSFPEAIAIYDDHNAPRIGGISNFFTIYEALNDGYRFLLDLEIVPVNGKFALSIQKTVSIDRRNKDREVTGVSSAHLDKLAHACSAIGFIAFTGDTEIS
jgi:hypothetical protein